MSHFQPATGVRSVTVAGVQVRRVEVLGAIAECRALGLVRFLRKHGYRKASRFHLRWNGLSYPSKAILGVAAGLKSSEFFGGAAGAAAQLARLGFQVRNSATGALMSRELDSLRRACLREGLDVEEQPWPTTDVIPTAYFASGSNRALEIRALARAGADVGVAAQHTSPAAEAELGTLAGSDVLVFVDSGAFSEVDRDLRVVKPISPATWAKRLGLYKRLSATLGDQVWLVAPDRVGCQETTLARLTAYRAEVRECRDLGARILVPLQRGELSQEAMAQRVDEVLGFTDWIPTFPCKKAATSPEEIAAYVRARDPRHVHLLGKGIRARDLGRYLAPFAQSRATVSLDACWLAQNSGRTNGPKNGPRRLTRARDVAERVIARLGTRIEGTELAVYCCLAGGLVR